MPVSNWDLRPRKIVLFFTGFIALIAIIGGIYMGVAQPWNTEATPAKKLPCAERIPAHVGETCTDRVTLGGATGERYYVAEKVTPDSNVIDFDERKLTVTISGKPSLDDFCNADAIASLTDDHNSVTHNAQANSELCAEIRALTTSEAYDARYWCEYKMVSSLKRTDSITWDEIDTSYFTTEVVRQICSTPLWPTLPNEVTHA